MSGVVRLTDILTNAAAIADYAGAPELQAQHLLDAISHLREGRAWSLGEDDVPRSPLGRSSRRATVPPAIRDLAQEWFRRLGDDPHAELKADQLEEFVAALQQVSR